MMKSPIQLFIALAILLATATVAAQVYKWVDKDGKVQYTDTPPPPGAAKADPKKVETGASGEASAAAPSPKSLQERAKEFDKRRTDETNKAKKDADAEKIAKDNEDVCRQTRASLFDLETGRPIYRFNEKGEREIVGEDQRNADMAKARQIIAATCKS
jgi:hypothetical protein